MLNAKLVVVGGDAKKAEVKLKLPTIIGRGKEAGLTVPHALVSRQHAEVFERQGRLFVRDLGSLNGTYVNNTRIEEEQPLDPAQLLTLGNITFRAVYEVDAEVPISEFDRVSSQKQPETLAHRGDSIQIQTACGNGQTASISDVISFDETVPVDLISAKSEIDAATQNQLGRREESNGKPEEPDFFQEKQSRETTASDTDKSFSTQDTTSDGSIGDSSIFSFDTDETDPANKSISASSLEDLPSAPSPVGMIGTFELGENADNPVGQIDSVEIELDKDEPKATIDDDSSLGSFLKKLPR